MRTVLKYVVQYFFRYGEGRGGIQFWNHGSISYGRRTNLGAFYVTAPDALLTIIPFMKEWPKHLNQFRKEIIDP